MLALTLSEIYKCFLIPSLLKSIRSFFLMWEGIESDFPFALIVSKNYLNVYLSQTVLKNHSVLFGCFLVRKSKI